MKKMYFLTVLIIVVITLGFLFLFCDESTLCLHFLSSFDIAVEKNPASVEELLIPETFDDAYESYNLLQAESGLDLSPYRGKKAVRFTYKVTNFPEESNYEIYANVILVNRRPVAGDIVCPSLDGFILPLSYIKLHN